MRTWNPNGLTFGFASSSGSSKLMTASSDSVCLAPSASVFVAEGHSEVEPDTGVDMRGSESVLCLDSGTTAESAFDTVASCLLSATVTGFARNSRASLTSSVSSSLEIRRSASDVFGNPSVSRMPCKLTTRPARNEKRNDDTVASNILSAYAFLTASDCVANVRALFQPSTGRCVGDVVGLFVLLMFRDCYFFARRCASAANLLICSGFAGGSAAFASCFSRSVASDAAFLINASVSFANP